MTPKLGILGGMGPVATVDFLHKLVERAAVPTDEEHVPVVVYSVPRMPNRMKSIFENGPSPLPDMLEGIETLRRAGAVCIVMPCNTAHYWYDDLAAAAKVPFLHIADAGIAAIKSDGAKRPRVGIAGTRGTLATGFYQKRLAARDFEFVVNTEADQSALVDPAIKLIKANDIKGATPLIARAVGRLLEDGADVTLLACTEIPLVMPWLDSAIAQRCIDVNIALADASIAWWQSHYGLAADAAAPPVRLKA